MDSVSEALSVLGLGPKATPQEIGNAYRALVKKWHPDKFVYDERQGKEAARRFKVICAAFELLQTYQPAASTKESPQRSTETVEHPTGADVCNVPNEEKECVTDTVSCHVAQGCGTNELPASGASMEATPQLDLAWGKIVLHLVIMPLALAVTSALFAGHPYPCDLFTAATYKFWGLRFGEGLAIWMFLLFWCIVFANNSEESSPKAPKRKRSVGNVDLAQLRAAAQRERIQNQATTQRTSLPKRSAGPLAKR